MKTAFDLRQDDVWKIGVKYSIPDFSQEHFTPRSANRNELIDGSGDICLCPWKLLQPMHQMKWRIAENNGIYYR